MRINDSDVKQIRHYYTELDKTSETASMIVLKNNFISMLDEIDICHKEIQELKNDISAFITLQNNNLPIQINSDNEEVNKLIRSMEVVVRKSRLEAQRQFARAEDLELQLQMMMCKQIK